MGVEVGITELPIEEITLVEELGDLQLHNGLESLIALRQALEAGAMDECFFSLIKNSSDTAQLFGINNNTLLVDCNQSEMVTKLNHCFDMVYEQPYNFEGNIAQEGLLSSILLGPSAEGSLNRYEYLKFVATIKEATNVEVLRNKYLDKTDKGTLYIRITLPPPYKLSVPDSIPTKVIVTGTLKDASGSIKEIKISNTAPFLKAAQMVKRTYPYKGAFKKFVGNQIINTKCNVITIAVHKDNRIDVYTSFDKKMQESAENFDVSTEGLFDWGTSTYKPSHDDDTSPTELDNMKLSEFVSLKTYIKVLQNIDEEKLNHLTIGASLDIGELIPPLEALHKICLFLNTLTDTSKSELDAPKGEFWDYMVKEVRMIQHITDTGVSIENAPSSNTKVLTYSGYELKGSDWLDLGKVRKLIDLLDSMYDATYQKLGDRTKQYFNAKQKTWDEYKSLAAMPEDVRKTFCRQYDIVIAWNRLQMWREHCITTSYQNYGKVLRALTRIHK